MKHARHRKRTIGITVVLLVLVGLGVAGYLQLRRVLALLRGGDGAQSAVITVQTEPVARRDIAEYVTAAGRIQPLVLVKISPEVSGEIVELPVKEGQTVKKGDLILRIKPDYYVAARNSAEAAYKSAVANQNLAKASLEKATFEFKRAQDLFQAKLVSDSEF